MSTLPTFQSVLLEVHKALACPSSLSTNTKSKFIEGECSFDKLIKLQYEFLSDIFDALEMKPDAQLDAMKNIMEFGSGITQLSQHVWTFHADQRQVLWAVLTQYYIPGIARFTANWQLDTRWDKGMPGGRFWYLPERREVKGETELVLPVSQVVEWLLDILGMSIEQFADLRSEDLPDEYESLKRTLYLWMNDTSPEAKTIQKYFPDELSLTFSGAFMRNEVLKPDEQFSEAMDFVRKRNLSADALRAEIPMTQSGRIEAVLSGGASEEEQSHFIDCLCERFQAPSMHTIRQRLLVARAVQEGYIALLKFLCPEVNRLCANPSKNKLLQVCGIYEMVYNLTIGAHAQCKHQGFKAENKWFEEHIPVPYHITLLLSVLPSLKQHGVSKLASRLTRQFQEMKAGTDLGEVFAFDEQSYVALINQERDLLARRLKEDEAIESLNERIRVSSPWRALQKESSFWIVSQLAQRVDLPYKPRTAAINRAYELARNADEQLMAIGFEIESLIGDPNTKRTMKVRARVEELLLRAEALEHSGLWTPPLLRLKGLHALACNDLTLAEKLFRQALDGCAKRSYGQLKGTLARDALAVAVAERKVNKNNHQRYFRYMLLEAMVEGGELEKGITPDIEDIAVSASEYFWETLYRPYQGVENIEKRSRFLFEQSINMLFKGDMTSLSEWVKDNKERLSKPMPGVRGDSLLMSWIKLRNDFVAKAPVMRAMFPNELQRDLDKVDEHLAHWRRAIAVLAKEAPKQLNIPDFKGQTPLMLIAEVGDSLMVSELLKYGADPNAQDYVGRTALHGAVKSHDLQTVLALVESPCDVSLTTVDGRTALHTASWCGNTEAVRVLAKQAPMLVWRAGESGPTPLELVEELIENPDALNRLNGELRRNRRQPVGLAKLKEVLSVLEEVPYPEN